MMHTRTDAVTYRMYAKWKTKATTQYGGRKWHRITSRKVSRRFRKHPSSRRSEERNSRKRDFDELENETVSIAGRMMFKRVMGKASFCNVQDKEGRIQVYVARDDLGEEAYKEFKRMDIGDIIGVKGFVFKTKTGEISVHAKELTLLSKSLTPLPEKFHGLQDTDLRYRQRYVDLIMNEESRETFIKRSKIISEIRKFLDARGFMEVETPMLVSNAGGAAARPFETHFNALDEDVKLRISLDHRRTRESLRDRPRVQK